MEGCVYKVNCVIWSKGKWSIEFTSRRIDSEIPKDRTIYVEVSSKPKGPVDVQPHFVEVEEMPEFPGGEAAMMTWINKNLKYPDEARALKSEGHVRVRFYIDTKGKTQEIVVMKSDNPLFDNEAIRIISVMSEWKPGKQGGQLVDVYKMVTIDFKLN